jgi:hypothetical protein
VVAYVRTVKTGSGAIAVQIVWSSRRGSRRIEHLRSAHDGSEVEALKAAARQRLTEGQGAFDLGVDATAVSGGPLEIVSSRTGHLWDALCRVHHLLGFDHAAGGDEVFRIWCWPGSSSRPVSRTRCGCSLRLGWSRLLTGR